MGSMKRNSSLASRRMGALACGTALACLVPVSVLAQEQAADAQTAADQDDQIIVTARFRPETIQETPISITALTGEMLEQRGVQSVEGIARATPNITLERNTAGYGKSVIAYIRGVGQSDFLPAFEPGVGIYIDDVYHGTLFGSLFDFADVQQVEVLRGPQGTLFGKNNEGGAIRVTTREAQGDNTGYLEAGLGSFNRMTLRGAYDTSLVDDRVFLRVAGGFNNVDGYMDTIDFTCANPTLAGRIPSQVPASASGDCRTGTLGGQQTFALRGNLRILATDDLEISINADLLDDKGEPAAEKLIDVNTDGTSPLALYQPGSPFGSDPTGYGIPFDKRFITNDPYTSYVNFTDSRNGLTFPRVSNVRSWGVSGKVEWDINPDLNFTSISAYRTYRGEFIENWGASPIHINDNYFKPYHDQFSQELRLNGRIGDLAEWTVGGFYYTGLTELNDYIYIPLVNFAFFGVDPVRDRDLSGFAHVVLTPTDRLSFEAGLRYSDISKTYTFNRYLPNTGNPPATLPGFENNPAVRSTTSRVDYRLSASYDITPDVMTYAVFSTGFKGPGVNPRPSSAAELLSFDEEELTAYEIGLKADFLDGRVRANLSAYRSDYSNLQLTVVRVLPSGVPGSITANAGKARIQGFEGEFTLEPVDNLMVNASVGYLDFQYLDLGDAANQPGGPCLTCVAAYVPEWSFTAGAQYDFDLGDVGTLTPRIDYAYKSQVFSDAANYGPGAIPGYGLWNARLSYTTPDEDFNVSLQVNNLTDKFYFVNKFQGYFALGTLVGQPAMPRTFLLTLRHNFQ
ncbi:TonB-dependent receptor [Alteraurantiacibacter buctensis]|uniref:TonB-dependent receptor n=1 Tax=Alteraurantiacibacter buctensis TaxID=1503981 RepID=A0A844Z206_9SPHN|nr:TonB-dependent receptor [Alteraurantiacibacter buctensis]MXO73021.1 TonB-dependent receptor [Alteraurantiacibacter buctensis]